jgi:hypothetical protein
MPLKVRAIFFDAGDTLVFPHYSFTTTSGFQRKLAPQSVSRSPLCSCIRYS